MKKITGYIFAFTGMLLLNSCQKELTDPGTAGINNNNNNINNNIDFKVRKYREDYFSTGGNTSETFNLTYDATNRLVTMVDSADATTRFLYTYNSSNNYTMEFFNVGVLFIHEDFFLNTASLIDSTSQYNDTGDTTLEKYIYDASNHITQVKDYDYTTAGGPQLFGTTDLSYNADGNVIQEADSNSGEVITYEYFTDLNTIDVGKPYESKNKNLTKKTTTVNGGNTIVINHTYTYDNLNRVTTETQQYSTGETVIRTYTY